jgi:DNA-binding response OmpR family regulator
VCDSGSTGARIGSFVVVSGTRILVIDGDRPTRQLLHSVLERQGCSVLGASDGEEGLRLIQGERPDLVISEVMTARLDGFELARRLRSDPAVRTTPLMLLSARAEEQDKVKGLTVGADDYMTKPFGTRELVARVGAIIRRHEMFGSQPPHIPQGPFAAEGLKYLAKYRFDSFVVGGGNRSAYEAARAAAASPGVRFNPLFLYGGPGLGKTHLMCAIANRVFEKNNAAKALYLTSEVLSGHIVDAHRNRYVDRLRRDYLDADVLVVDDIQFLSISESLQSVAADILSDMYDHGKQIVISSDRRPEKLRTLSTEISTAFALGLVVRMERPDAVLRTEILRFKARRNGWPIRDDLLAYLGHQVDADVRTLEGLASKLVAMNTLTGAPVERTVVDTLIRDVTLAGVGRWPVSDARPVSVRRPLLPTAKGPVPWRTRENMQRARSNQSLPRAIGVQRRWRSEIAAPKYPNPLVTEFPGDVPVRRVSGLPEDVAASVPQVQARPIVVLGASSSLVQRTVEALMGRSGPSRGPLGDERWAYMAHVEGRRPNWLLVGTSVWNGNGLAEALTASQPPVFLVVLDGKSPQISEARELLASVPKGHGLVVVVTVNAFTEGKEALAEMLRPLFGVPKGTPVVVASGVHPVDSRRWVQLALS